MKIRENGGLEQGLGRQKTCGLSPCPIGGQGMRCFVAIEFDDGTRAVLDGIQEYLRENGIRGNFSRLPNLHLTLKFLGEVSPASLPALESVLQKVALRHEPFVLELGELGKFSKGSRPIIWCGIKPNKQLFSLQKDLADELAAAFSEFSGQERYKPHITLAREAALDDSRGFAGKTAVSHASEGTPLDDLLKHARVPEHRIAVGGISLMESTRREGKLVYLQQSFFPLSKN